MVGELHSPSTINYKVNEANTAVASFILAYNKTNNTFILHARISSDFLATFNRKTIIQSLGFMPSQGCDFFGGSECFHTSFYSRSKNFGDRHDPFDREVEYAHEMFKKFTSDFTQICDHAIALEKLIPRGFMKLPIPTYSFEIEPKLLEAASSTPLWVEKEAPKVQTELRDEILGKIEILKSDFVSFSGLLYQTGDELEQAVKTFLDFLEMATAFTEQSFPVDILATKENIAFAVEVTGTTGNISNKDRKVGQVITYAGEKKEGEKIILVANTFRDTAVKDRPVESYTKEAIKILAPFEVCLVTGVQLYTLWKDILEQKKAKEEVIKLLGGTIGVL